MALISWFCIKVSLGNRYLIILKEVYFQILLKLLHCCDRFYCLLLGGLGGLVGNDIVQASVPFKVSCQYSYIIRYHAIAIVRCI